MDPSPALRIGFPSGTTAPLRDRLIALLSDFELVAVQEDDLHAPQLWVAHFSRDTDRDAAAAAVRADPEFERLSIETAAVEDEDWARRTQADLPAVRIGRIIVAPPWDLPPASTAHLTIVIEPSRGFGTGHHQSTRLCLVLLQARELSRTRVLDVGTGSGVLAIAAARLGAPFVAAIDNDPDAVENARENIVRNGVETIVQAHVGDFTRDRIEPADLLTANLTGTMLSRYAAKLASLVRPGGTLIASGFNIDEQQLVEDALTPHFHIAEAAEEEGWLAFAALRRLNAA